MFKQFVYISYHLSHYRRTDGTTAPNMRETIENFTIYFPMPNVITGQFTDSLSEAKIKVSDLSEKRISILADNFSISLTYIFVDLFMINHFYKKPPH